MTTFQSKELALNREPQENSLIGPPKVMIVEDEVIIALDIRRQLIRAGFVQSGMAQSGQQAMREIERERPDIVLMDIHLKGEMDGIQTAELIRNRYDLPVIYLTAHGDNATLDRALTTEPFGYLIKPLVNANLNVTIRVALRKHQMEFAIQNSRRLLSAILQGVPEAVLVADPSGRVLYLNRTAEEMTGWTLHEASGKGLGEVATIFNNEGEILSSKLSNKIGTVGGLMRIPPDSTLLMKDGQRIDIGGRLSILTVGGENAGLILTLQEVSFLKGEGRRLRQEQQMFVTDELAQNLGRELSKLFGLIDSVTDGGSNGSESGGIDLIHKASRVGANMCQQLLALKEEPSATRAINVKQSLTASQSLLQELCGRDILLEISAAPPDGYILSTGNHFEQLLVNLVLESRRRLDGQGTLSLGADIHTQPGSGWQLDSYIRVFARAEKSILKASETSAAAAGELPSVGFSIVQSIALSAQGFTRVRELSDSISIIEVFLPQQQSPKSVAMATNQDLQTILLAGLPPALSESIKSGQRSGVLFLEAADVTEVRLVAQLYENKIDLVIWDDVGSSAEARTRTRNRIQLRRPDLLFMDLSTHDNVAEEELLEIHQRINELLGKKRSGAPSLPS